MLSPDAWVHLKEAMLVNMRITSLVCSNRPLDPELDYMFSINEEVQNIFELLDSSDRCAVFLCMFFLCLPMPALVCACLLETRVCVRACLLPMWMCMCFLLSLSLSTFRPTRSFLPCRAQLAVHGGDHLLEPRHDPQGVTLRVGCARAPCGGSAARSTTWPSWSA